MEIPDRLVCCNLCICMATTVFSSVSLVYLTALVYMPTKREINSGLELTPVMCTTLQRQNIVIYKIFYLNINYYSAYETDNCDWYSCGEWCLSKSNHCVKIWASVRKNGSDIELDDCSELNDITCQVSDHEYVTPTKCSMDSDCSSLDSRFFKKCDQYHHNNCEVPGALFKCDPKFSSCVSTREFHNCKLDNVCTDLNHLFFCKNGLCKNVTDVYDCHFSITQPPLDCTDKRNCITLEGFFVCLHGQCTKIEWPWHCERRCRELNISRSNVILLSGDRILSAQCKSITDLSKNISISDLRSKKDIFTASCTFISKSNKQFNASDCVNGTFVNKNQLRDLLNYTYLYNFYSNPELSFKPTSIAFEKDLIIYDKSRVLINTEGCVNSLMGECAEFLLEHKRDGRNYSAVDRYPCFYTSNHGDYVTTRYSIIETKNIFLLAFFVPFSIFLFSCTCLISCSKLLRVDDDGQMRLVCRKRKEYDPPPLKIPRLKSFKVSN